MKYIILIIALIAGGFVGQLKSINRVVVTKKKVKCDFNGERKVEAENLETSCPLFIPNMGLLHNRSGVESRAKVYNFFSDDLKKFYENPNEFNVHTNDSGAGKSAQKYDPRDDLYVRFSRTAKFDKKTNFGVTKSFPKEPGCQSSFSPIVENEKLQFYKLLKDKVARTYKRYLEDHHTFSFLSIAMRDDPFNDDYSVLRRYRLFRNNCSKAVSVILNFCLSDPRYDLQYEDMFVLEDGTAAKSMIYCKRSSDKNWTLISSKDFKLEEAKSDF